MPVDKGMKRRKCHANVFDVIKYIAVPISVGDHDYILPSDKVFELCIIIMKKDDK